MKIVRKTEGTAYEAPFHHNVFSIRKLGEGDTQSLAISLSHFLPNGRLDMSGSPPEKAYYIISGSMAVKPKDGEEVKLHEGDIVYFAGGEEREGRVLGNEICTILVFVVKVKG